MALELEQYDVLIYMSDQHTASIAGFMGDPVARTPMLDAIASQGVVFDNAYTSCPLCAPARASFLTAQIPSRLGVFDNACDYKSSDITFAHLHALQGYEAVLIGRMHFNGMDHLHGFTKRLGKDLTASYWGYPATKREDLGDFRNTFNQKGCMDVIGSGDSPVLEFDRQVVDTALEYLSGDYAKPQLMVVGTYGPHFPYVADRDLMNDYRQQLAGRIYREELAYPIPSLQAKARLESPADILEATAAYYAMVETMDRQVGEVYRAFRAFLERNGRWGAFVYLSDHGDQLGCKGLFGKQSFFEGSAKIPLVLQADGLAPGRIGESVSIMDVGPTLCELNGCEPYPDPDGASLLSLARGQRQPGRYAVSEFYDPFGEDIVLGRMIHQDGKKLISYQDLTAQDLLFDTGGDPGERHNLTSTKPQLHRHLSGLLKQTPIWPDRRHCFRGEMKKHHILRRVGAAQTYLNEYTYTASESARSVDENIYKRL